VIGETEETKGIERDDEVVDLAEQDRTASNRAGQLRQS